MAAAERDQPATMRHAAMPSRPRLPLRLGEISAPGFLWAVGGVLAGTGGLWLARGYLDKGQASLLYLPVVIACAVRFGFGPAVLGACLSFLCWDFFFLPPLYTFVVHDYKDWLSLIVFLVAAVTTAQLAANARVQAEEAVSREEEIGTLYQASEAISQEISADNLLPTLARLLQTLCHATSSAVFQWSEARGALCLIGEETADANEAALPVVREVAGVAYDRDQVLGFGASRLLLSKAVGDDRRDPERRVGVYVPLRAEGRRVGVLYVGPRQDGQPYSPLEERLIFTLANHVAVVIARQALATAAAQARALQEADLLKDALLSLVSHELRSPLASIKATASGLLQPDAVWTDSDRTEAVRAINGEADRLTALVTNLLDLSRLEAGAWRPAKDWCDLVEIIGTVLERLPPDQSARVCIAAPPDLPLVRADFIQIALVLTNLLENAVKYAPGSEGIDLTVAPTGDGFLKTTVRDFGPGLTPGEEEQLFLRFYRGTAHQNGTVHGTGIGLALSRAIVQAHGGRIWAANAPPDSGGGAVFAFTLPLEDADGRA